MCPSYLAHPAPHDPLLAEPRHIEQCAHIRNTNRRLSCALVAGIDEGVRQLGVKLYYSCFLGGAAEGQIEPGRSVRGHGQYLRPFTNFHLFVLFSDHHLLLRQWRRSLCRRPQLPFPWGKGEKLLPKTIKRKHLSGRPEPTRAESGRQVSSTCPGCWVEAGTSPASFMSQTSSPPSPPWWPTYPASPSPPTTSARRSPATSPSRHPSLTTLTGLISSQQCSAGILGLQDDIIMAGTQVSKSAEGSPHT